MRILHVIPSLAKGGAERLVSDIVAGLKQKEGLEVKLAVFRDDNNYPDLLPASDVEQVDSAVYFPLIRKGYFNIDEYEELVDRFKPELIHSHLLESETITRANPRPGIRYLTHWHGYHAPTNPVKYKDILSKQAWGYRKMRKYLRKQYKQADNHFLCISEDIREYVIRLFAPRADRIKVLPNAIDLRRFKPAEKPKKDADKIRLVTIGSLMSYKNQQAQLDVMARLTGKGYNNVHLNIIGEGPQRPVLEQKIKRLKLEGHVRLMGYVDRPEEVLRESDIYLHTATQEPFGLVLVEAMACGLPVVAYDAGGNRELVRNGENGYLVRKNDIKRMTEAVVQLIEVQAIREKLQTNALAYSQQFGIDKYVEELLAYYKKITGKQP